jgi:hypothetical protein
MWLCTKYGFYSIVQKAKDEFHIRGRVKNDLDNIVRLMGWDKPVHTSKNADYRYRVICNQAEAAALLQRMAMEIDYGNFKNRIHDTPDQKDKCHAYSEIWGIMYGVQE